MKTAGASRKSLRRFAIWVGGSVALALASWGAVGLAQYGFDRWRPPPPPIDEQLSHVSRDAAKAEMRVAESTEADLHGSGEMSRIFVLRSTQGSGNELRIYDVSGGRLRDRLRFEPKVASHGGLNPDISLRLDGMADVDGNGRDELVVSLDEEYGDNSATAPLLVEWDPLTDDYRITPFLTPDRPKLGGPTRPVLAGRRGGFFVPPPELYTEPLTIRNRATGATFRSYAADVFLVRRSAFSRALVAGFIVGSGPRGPSYLLRAWSISDAGPPPLLYPCLSLNFQANESQTITFRPTGDQTAAAALARAWPAARGKLNC